MTDLTNVVMAAIGLILAITAAFVIPYLKSKTSAEKLKEIQIWVTAAVKAAEMIFSGTGRGAEKKEYVLNFLQEKGFTIDLDSIYDMIEAAVLELKQSVLA